MNWFAAIVIVLILARWAMELWLERTNKQHVQLHAGAIPEPFRGMIDPPTYKRSVDYTLAKARFSQIELSYDTLILLLALFSGILPWFHDLFRGMFGDSIWAGAAFLFAVGILLSLPGLPFSWHAQFRLEDRFGFNTTTPKLWWIDRAKGLLLAVLLGYPLLALVLKIVDWTGDLWWLVAWGVVLAFQLLMLVLAPIFILPLFNKFTPLPEGSLRERLYRLADRTGFHASSIQVMDGSKRSKHSNAFFTGFRRFRKIVLFDTLVEQLTEQEIEAVLAHEIGHYKRKHIPKMLAFSAASSLAGFWVLAFLARQEWFYRSFGFSPDNIVPAFLLFGLLSGAASFWLSPLTHWWSRKYEYEADAYAKHAVGESRSLIGALRKLSEKNLSNLTPHPIYSGFYYSHPTLLEREAALASA